MLPALEFSRYDRARHELANFVDRNTLALRSKHRDIRYDESLRAAFDWDHSLRLFARTEPLALPVVSCYYRTVVAGRVSDVSEQSESVRRVRSRTHTTRSLRVHVHTAMYPVISETYIGEDIDALRRAGATVTVSAVQEAASRAEGVPSCSLDGGAAIEEARSDVVLMHWVTHAVGELPLMQRVGQPFACRVHSFDLDADRVAALLGHPLCIAVFAHPHLVPILPPGVQPLLPTVGPGVVIPESPAARSLVLSVSAGIPKKDFPLLVDAMAQLPGTERSIILARSNGHEALPGSVESLAAARDPDIAVRVNVARSEVLGEIARASVFIYTLDHDAATMGFPMSIIEAMLCGTIVIAPDRPEAHEIVGEHLRPYRSAEDIVRHVREVEMGGPSVKAARDALRVRARRHRDPAELRRLYDALRDGLTAWRLARM